MKIRKTPSKRLAPVPRPLRDVIKSLEREPEDQIPIHVDKVKEWTYPRGDLFHWSAVLNRFDTILLRICNDYKLTDIQTREFDPSTKRLLLAMVNLSRILFDNCTNRNIYNSYEHMNSLMNSMDIDVLEAVLSFLLRPAQRVNNPRAIRSTFVSPQERITELARGWSVPARVVDLSKDDFSVTDDMKMLKLRFYRTQDESSEGTSKSTETQNADNAEGVNIIATQLPSTKDKSDTEVFRDLVKEHNIPKEYHFELANRIRVCRHIDDSELRKKLLIIRILAIAIMANTVSETTAQNKVFIYEPHLVANLAELVHPDKAVPDAIRVYSLCALDGIARHRSKLSEVLTALNASANHGTLLQILRRISQEQGNLYSRGFLDALFTLLACLLQNQPGGQMLMSAGIIPSLVQILGNSNCIQTKYVSKVVSLLDAIVNAFSTSFSAFCNAGGLDTLLNRIKTEVEYCLQDTDVSMKASEDNTSQQDEQNAQTPLAPHDHISALKAMLRFLLRMMESSGTADGLRNLIESSIPQSLLQIISNPKVFGSSVLPLAINVMTTFIHSEPTSLPILQEAKLPQGFLDMICAYDTPSSEVLMASVNAFGAICLNQQGLDMFNEANPLPHFFDLMTEHDFLLNAAEVDSATALGSTMDELTRHHPSLRPKVFECVSSMIKKVKKLGTEDIAKPSDNSHRLQLMPTAEGDSGDVTMKSESSESKESESSTLEGSEKKNEKSECLLVSFIDMVSRFLEGLFQNQTNIREFVKEGCPEILLDYYTLPLLPADFSVTIASDSLAYIFKMISEVSTLPTIMAIAEKAQNSMKFILEDDRVRKESIVAPFVDVKDNETSKIEEGNTLFRQLIIMHGYVGLLSNICTSAALAPGKSATSLITEFMSGVGDENIVLMLGRLHRTMMWENFLLKESVPGSWYSVKTAKKPHQTSTDHPLGIFGVSTEGEENQRETPEPAPDSTQGSQRNGNNDGSQEEKVPDINDPRMQNLKHFKLLLGDIPQFLMPIFQGLVRASMSRRMMDNAQKAQAFRVTECMTELLKDNLTWRSITAEDAPPCKYDYLATMYSMISLLVMDDRPQSSLHTPLALTFDRREGTDLLLKDLDSNWKEASKVHAVPKDQRSKEQSNLLQRIYSSLEMLLTVLAYIGSSKLLHDSPFTAPIVVKDTKAKDHFDPYAWIISMQLKLSSVKVYLCSPDLKEFPKGIIHVLLDIILEIMKAEEENNLRSEPFNIFAAPLSSPFTLVRTPVVATPDERGVQTLVDMGFERSAAEHAMVRCNNQISRAVDWLFSHPTQMLSGGGTSGQGSSRGRSQDNTDDNHEDSSDEEADGNEADEPSDRSTSGHNAPSASHMDEDQDDDDDPESDSEDDNGGEFFPSSYRSGHSGASSSRDNATDESNEEGSSDQRKRKAEVAEKAQELQKIRNTMKEEIPPLVLDLVDKREDVIFDVRDLLVSLCKDDTENKVTKNILFQLIDRIESARAHAEEPPKDQSPPITKYMRLLALLFREQALQSVIPDTAARLSFLFDMVDNASRSSADTKLPLWITTAFLVLESFISQADEPKKTELIRPKTDETSKSKTLSRGSEQSDNNASKEAMDQEGPTAVSEEQRSRLLINCITFLKKPDLSRDEIYAILRVIVRLTRYHGAALQFVEHGGLPLLFTKPRTSLEGLQGQQAFIILILRHIIEDKATLESSMEDMITTWFTIPRPRNMDVSAFIRNNAHIVLRDPAMFLKVATRICRLTHYDEYDLPRQVKLLTKEVANDGDTTMVDAPAAETSESSGTRQGESSAEENRPKTSSSSCIINHLLQELVSAQSEVAEIRRSKDSSEKEKTDSDAAKREENVKYAYIGFILQCLVELVSSYKSCKYDVYNFGRRRNSKDGSSARPKHSIINMLINDLLPCNAINPIAEESKRQQGLSMWTASVLVAMCHDSGPDKESNNSTKEDLTQVRKYVFDGIIRSLKETSASSGPLSTKYAKYLALSDLCFRILNARPNANGPAQRVKEDSATDIAKIMLDKNFVGLLTSAISDVDINYPHSKTILNTMLRPLEQLTKLAVKISEDMKEDDKKRDEEQQHYVPTHESGEGEEEPPDLYRNSALGMFDASVMEEDEMDEFDSDEEGEETYDEEEFDEDTGSDLSDMSEGETGDEDVDEEMDAMLHQHYDTEMEDEEDGTEDDEDEEVDDTDDESRIGETDEDDVEEEEDGREMTWRLEDIEGDPVIQVSAEVELESGDEGHDQQHRRLLDAFGEEQDEEELETVDQSDFDEDEESENMEGAEADADLNDGVLLEDDIDSPFLTQDLEADGLLMEDEGRSRTFPGFHMRRFNRLNRARFSEQGLGRSLRSIRGGGGADGQDDVITHPLLSENQASAGTSGQPSRTLPDISSHARSRSPAYNSWQAFEDIIGGSAVRLLESLLTQAPQGAQTGPLRVDVQGRGGGIMRTFEFDHLPIGPRAAARSGEPQSQDQNRELMAVLHDFQPMTSVDRWHQEARMMYGSSLADKAQNVTNALLNALIPIAIEDEKKQREEDERRRQEQRRIEEEERKKAEEERWRREEEERRRREEEEANQAAESARQAESQETTTTGEVSEGASTEAQAQGSEEGRVMITINGEQVDISGTGIDIEFLQALPDDLREEVVSQHMRERRASTQATETDSISPEFLDALPPDIREEVLHQETLERERRDRQRQGAAGGTGTPSNEGRYENSFRRFLSARTGQRREGEGTSSTTQSQRRSGAHRNAMQLVDRQQLATLARLLFVPQSISKAVLNRLLINLCENSKTRSDLLSFLVCVLHDGSGDLAAVDRSFAQLSLQSKGIYKPVPKSKTSAAAAMGETVPNLITQRCLEFLMHVVQWNDQSLTYFLTENDCLAGLKRTSSRKGKSKEKVTPSSKYPLLVLISLLDRPVFVENPSLMEELMHLIMTICRPFPLLVKKYVEKVENQQQQQQSAEEQAKSEGQADGESGEKQQQKGKDEEAGDGNKRFKDAEKTMPKPPTIPDHYLKLVVHVLTSGECSSKTFQYTLSALSHLSALDGAQQAITNELLADAKESGEQILRDLNDLHGALENAMPGTEIDASALSHFSAATSHQAKLLRVLKTIDYMYSRKAAVTTAVNPEKSADDEAAKNERRLLEIYDELNFLPLWKTLGQCLSVIHEKEELINVATVLLPLIESFMVVSKYAAEKGQIPRNSGGSLGSPPPNSTQQAGAESPDDFFFTFTEEHKKILNIMVRNNPSLMSGSFSLLVRNPKMLEFDNKRSYFVQQLHKRTSPREHYPPLQLNVRRQYVFEDSYHQLLGRTGDEIKYGKLSVRFYDEEGVDAGGVAREWFSVLARQMFDPNYALFITSAADKLTYQPNRASAVNPDHLSYLKFVGRVIGKAIYDGRLLDAYFTRSFYKHILGRPVDYRDVEAIDPEYYKSLVWMLENDITDIIDLTFSIETDDFGTTKVIDLKPNGRNIPVTEENKHEYVALVTEQKLTLAIKDQINAFLQGFHDIIPAHLIQIFNEQELELLISGLPDIDIDDWKNNTEYQGGYNASSPQIQWFWRAVRSFDQEERAKLLQFATGTSKVPLEGFAHLQGSGGVQRFQIHKDFGGENRLPSAHTCFNQVDLPEYDSYESLRSNLFKAINECSTGFGFV